MKHLLSLLCGLLALIPVAVADENQQNTRYGGYILADDPSAATISGHLNLSMLRLFSEGLSDSDQRGVWVPLELRFDAGQLRKRDLSRAKNHFDEMFRRLSRGEFEEASEQIFRAERFARKTFPYSTDFTLLADILYYRSVVASGLSKNDESRDAYCSYLYLMSNLSNSSVAIGQKLQDLKSCSIGDETGELVVTSRVDGGLVYLDGVPIGVVSKDRPFTAPFLARGPHFVEVRKPGFSRWGEMVEIKPGKSIRKKVRLKRPRPGVNDRELRPLEEIALSGEDRSDDSYIDDRLFQYSQQVGVDVFVLGKLGAVVKGQRTLNLLRYDGNGLKRAVLSFDAEGFDYELIMLSALRQLELPVRSSSGTTANEDVRFLFFKVK